MMVLGDGRVGVVQEFPGAAIFVDRDGNPIAEANIVAADGWRGHRSLQWLSKTSAAVRFLPSSSGGGSSVIIASSSSGTPSPVLALI